MLPNRWNGATEPPLRTVGEVIENTKMPGATPDGCPSLRAPPDPSAAVCAEDGGNDTERAEISVTEDSKDPAAWS